MSEGQPTENPLWVQAARTLRAGAADDEVKQLALRHHREALRQYLVLRLGSEAKASEMLAKLSNEVLQWEPSRLMAAPGPRAQLFARAREMLVERGVSTVPRTSEVVPLEHGEQAAREIEKLAEHGEVLELRHARELSPVEIAHVLAVGEEEVDQRIQRAESVASGTLAAEDDVSLRIATARTFAATRPAEPVVVEGTGVHLGEGDVIGDRYVIDKAVGGGAFGQVYRASDKLVAGHQVALKMLHQPAASEDERQSQLRELRLIASVFHPSVVSYKDHGWYEGRLWFVMPWYEGEPLEDRMLREPLSREEAVRIFTPLANALSSMHAAGVRHQDIKPENIFLAELATDPLADGLRHPVLLDLGVAATESDSIVAGTPAYFAPEVAAHCVGASDPPPITEKADVFSLALALRNALEPSTQQEVQGSAVHMFIAFRAEQPPDPPSGKALQFLRPYFERWLALNPDDRPTAAQFASELGVLIEPERRAQRRSAFLSWFVPTAAAFLLLMAGGAFAWSEQMREQETRAHAAEMKAQIAKLAAEREARLRTELEQVHGELQEQHEATTAELEDSEKQAQALSSRASRLARARRATLSELKERESELGELSAKADELHRTKAELESALSERERRIGELLSQAEELDALLSDTRELLTLERSQAKRLRDQLTQSEAEREKQKQDIERLTVERDEARTKVDARDKQLERERQRLAQKEAQVAKLNERITRLQKDKQRLNEQLDALRKANKTKRGAAGEGN